MRRLSPHSDQSQDSSAAPAGHPGHLTENEKDHRVRLAIGNGLRADVWKEFLARFGKIEVREFYASTEGNVGFMNYAGKIGAIGRVNFLQRKLFPYALIKYDTDTEEPVRDASGRCIQVSKGQKVNQFHLYRY
ncbi:hypothetical protein NFI96_005954 [Prochilodus magdalenae]|nr:hypothetical protein NFI96_005954 [Prochilodus magdalenae]